MIGAGTDSVATAAQVQTGQNPHPSRAPGPHLQPPRRRRWLRPLRHRAFHREHRIDTAPLSPAQQIKDYLHIIDDMISALRTNMVPVVPA